MVSFLQRHAADVIGHLKGWDRLRLRGTLRCIAFVTGLVGFLNRSGRKLEGFGEYAQSSSRMLIKATEKLAGDAGRPHEHLFRPGINKEELARQIAERDQVKEGLICVLGAVESCCSYRLVQKAGRPMGVQRNFGKCLHLYQYHIHPVFGFMHVRMQTWMPFTLQICINGREWLGRQMDAAGIKYLRKGNCFPWIQDLGAAQRLMDQQASFPWEPALEELVWQMTPAIGRVMAPYGAEYYWSIDESEWATDIMFRSERALSRIYPSLIRHGMESFGSRDVMRFLGQRVPLKGNAHPHDCREMVSDFKDRPVGIRIKHRLGRNGVKMYNKQGSLLRVETTINDVCQLKTPRRQANGQVAWKPMRKGVADARRRAELSNQCNERYAEAMAAAGTPVPLKTLTQGLCSRVSWKGQSIRGLNLFEEQDLKLLEIAGRGDFLINGLRNRDVQAAWFGQPTSDPAEKRRRASQITRKLRMLRAHGLIRKVPRTHRYFVTNKGRQVIATLIAARNADITQLTKAA